MSNSYFSFKQFTVYHDQCAMKVGIDGVLLGAWTAVEKANHILDIGTGTGLIALMLAQRTKAVITAIDIDGDAILQANENVKNSPWSERIQVIEAALQQFAESSTQRFDLIVSNPPYFINSTKTPDKNRTNARHTDSLTHNELIENAVKLLNSDGRLCIILPVIEGLQCVDFAKSKGLYCSKQIKVYPKPLAQAKRLLLEFTLQNKETTFSELVIENATRHQYSPEFSLLAEDFYLKL